MAFIFTGGLLMGPKGLAFSKNCCCRGVNCYCYTHFNFYGSQIVERKVVCYKAPYFDDATGQWVFEDGQPCVPPPSSQCSVNIEGILVEFCSCPKTGSMTGESFRWGIIADGATSSTSCTTITPPP